MIRCQICNKVSINFSVSALHSGKYMVLYRLFCCLWLLLSISWVALVVSEISRIYLKYFYKQEEQPQSVDDKHENKHGRSKNKVQVQDLGWQHLDTKAMCEVLRVTEGWLTLNLYGDPCHFQLSRTQKSFTIFQKQPWYFKRYTTIKKMWFRVWKS